MLLIDGLRKVLARADKRLLEVFERLPVRTYANIAERLFEVALALAALY